MVLDTLKEIIADAMGSRLKIDASDINENTEFITDLHADSVDIATIICDIEDEFNIEIPDNAAEQISTVNDVVEYLKKLEA